MALTCPGLNSTDELRACYDHAILKILEDVKDVVQDALDEPKPWIGLYIAAASAVCGLAMAVDVFYGFKNKRMWFPCKYFSLNATSLTLLSVAMKLTMDLTSSKLDDAGSVAGFSSFVFMLNAMGNFMTSLASMDDNEILLNLTALGILVVTVVTNQCIFMVQTNKVKPVQYVLRFDDYISVVLLLLLISLCTSAVIAPTTKRYIETKFSEMHKMVLNEKMDGAKFTAQELRVILKKYWVMAGTGNPQFVLARSVICVIPSVVCLVVTVKWFVVLYFYKFVYGVNFVHSESVYKWSFSWILIIQTVGAVIGSVASSSRLFVAARCRRIRARPTSFKVELTTETYWTQRLIDWREIPMPLHIRRFKIKKVLHISKKVLLNICIVTQVMIVVTSKLVLILSSWFVSVTFKFLYNVNELRRYVFMSTSDKKGHKLRACTNEFDFSPYVMLLEGELELPGRIIKNISDEADKLVHAGKLRKPKNIIELLQKSENFNGVSHFDRKNIASLHFEEPPNCWSLSVVTLTSIAIELPNISTDTVNKLLCSVSESLQFVNVIEEKFDTSGELVRIRNTADIFWERLEQNWQDKDVFYENMNFRTYKEKLLELSRNAKNVVMDFKNSMTDSVMNNPLNWPTEVIAANSMYRVCQSLLLIEIHGTEDQLDQNFFEQVTIIISDILAACLTNLAHVIFTDCHIISVEKRQESIRRALILMGESEEIIQCLEQREWPNLDPDYASDIEQWRAIIELEKENPV